MQHFFVPQEYRTTTLTSYTTEALTVQNSSLGCLLNMTFIPQRPVAEQRHLTNKWNEMGTDEPGNTDV